METVPVRLQTIGDVDRKDGGWVYTALAQFYEQVNDRLMWFTYGSGLKTIRERVPLGRVKIHSGHPWDANASTILGKVLEARETRGDGGVWYKGFLSSTEGAAAQKLIEGVVDENSLELFVIREDDLEVAIATVPEHVRRWIRVEPSGLTKVREVLEWRWDAIGLVSSSSQGRRALLDPPTLVPLEDLPLAAASTPWDPAAAAARVRAWAGEGDRPGESGRRRARLASAYLARQAGDPGAFLAQVADVVEGNLAVVPAAVEAARAEIHALAAEQPDLAIALALNVGRLEERLTAAAAGAYHPATDETPTTEEVGEEEGPAETPPTTATTEATSALQPTAGPGIDPPTETAGSNGDSASMRSREAKLRELRLQAVNLGMPELPDQEVGDGKLGGTGEDPPRHG